MSNYLSQGRVSGERAFVCLHLTQVWAHNWFQVFVADSHQLAQWLLLINGQTVKKFFCLIGAGRCWESKHQMIPLLASEEEGGRGVSLCGGKHSWLISPLLSHLWVFSRKTFPCTREKSCQLSTCNGTSPDSEEIARWEFVRFFKRLERWMCP